MKIRPTLFAKNDIPLFSFSLCPLCVRFRTHRVQTQINSKSGISLNDGKTRRKQKKGKKIRFEQAEKLSSRRRGDIESNEFPGVCIGGGYETYEIWDKRDLSRQTRPIYSQFPDHNNCAGVSRRSRFVDKETRVNSRRKSVKLTKTFVIPETFVIIAVEERCIIYRRESFASLISNLFDEILRDAS